MKTLLLILGGKTINNLPDKHFLLRTDAAIDYYEQFNSTEEILFLVSGRWTNVTDSFELTEAEIGKQYILNRIPDAQVYKEDISVDLIGNYAFSKPIIKTLEPTKVVIFSAEFMFNRNQTIAKKIFADDISYEHVVITNDLSDNQVLVQKELLATKLFNNLSSDIEDGDDSKMRDKLLYATPYYFKGVIKDKDFFDTYWEGGYDNYLGALGVRNEVLNS